MFLGKARSKASWPYEINPRPDSVAADLAPGATSASPRLMAVAASLSDNALVVALKGVLMPKFFLISKKSRCAPAPA